jgi:Seed maturation protein
MAGAFRFCAPFKQSQLIEHQLALSPVVALQRAAGIAMATERAEFGRAAASADPLDFVEALVHAPALEKITKAEAADIESLAARHHGGTVERGSFAAVAQKAAEHNERRAAERQYPENFGALAASALPAHVEEATAMGPHLRTITLEEAAVVMSLANRAGRHVEHGSFASLCQSAAEKNARALKRATTAASETPATAEHKSTVVPLSAGGDAAAART